MIDRRPLLTRLVDWFIPNRLRFTPWGLLLTSCFVWTCGNAPYWLSTDYFPLPHPVLLKYAPIFGVISLVALFSFIKKIFYKNVNPLSLWHSYDQTRLEEIGQLVGSITFGVIVYFVIGIFSSWFWVFNALFAVGLGSLVYILVSSYYLVLPGESDLSNDTRISLEPIVDVLETRGHERAKMNGSDEWMETLKNSPSKSLIEAEELRRYEALKEAPLTRKSLFGRAIDFFRKSFLNKPTLTPLPIRISQEAIAEAQSQPALEPISDFVNEPPPLGSWKEPGLETLAQAAEEDENGEFRFLVKIKS